MRSEAEIRACAWLNERTLTMIAIRLTVRYARYLLTSLATVAFGESLQ